jgi:hypothetical protein
VEPLARCDLEFREHLAQVPFDGSGADEELRADLGVRQSLTSELRDLLFLRREFPGPMRAGLPA